MATNRNVPRMAEANIETVAALEREFVERRTTPQRVADWIGRFSGTMAFVALHVFFFTSWFLLNSKHLHWIHAFDPYPFILLSMVVSVEAVLLSTFVLMMQNRMQQRADQRANLNLQIDLLAEREITKVLQIQRLVCEKLGISQAVLDRELQELTQVTPVQRLAQDLNKRLGDNPES